MQWDPQREFTLTALGWEADSHRPQVLPSAFYCARLYLTSPETQMWGKGVGGTRTVGKGLCPGVGGQLWWPLASPGPWTSSPGGTCEILRNAESQIPSETFYIRTYTVTRSRWFSCPWKCDLPYLGLTCRLMEERAWALQRGGSWPRKKWSSGTHFSPKCGIPLLFHHLPPCVTHLPSFMCSFNRATRLLFS